MEFFKLRKPWRTRYKTKSLVKNSEEMKRSNSIPDHCRYHMTRGASVASSYGQNDGWRNQLMTCPNCKTTKLLNRWSLLALVTVRCPMRWIAIVFTRCGPVCCCFGDWTDGNEALRGTFRDIQMLSGGGFAWSRCLWSPTLVTRRTTYRDHGTFSILRFAKIRRKFK